MLKGRLVSYILLGIMAVMFIGLCVLIVTNSFTSDLEYYKTFIDGKYSVDGGEWKPTIPGKMVDENFKEVKIRGKLTNELFGDNVLILSAKNVWYNLKLEDEIEIYNMRDYDDSPLADTPGYSINYAYAESIRPDTVIELTITNPYPMFSVKELDNFFVMYGGNLSLPYELFIQNKLPTIIVCTLICFFGVVAFPIAGFVMGGIDYRYLSFGIMSFFAGLYLLFDSFGEYLPLWVTSEVLCMAVDVFTNYLFAVAAAVYIKTNLSRTPHKIAANILMIGLAAALLLVSILHATGAADIYETQPYMMMYIGAGAVVSTFCLVREAISKSREAISVLISWTPIFVTVFLDGINSFVHFWDGRFFLSGIVVSLGVQIVQLVFDMRRQYKEQIHYQQMQKELYEARVSIMVSQIQPHFLYNSLTSIAMMCTKDPQLAKKATINFADYLRGNMNSLKEKNPVPFSRELEHLKKYLMLEQMRFGDMLNIEYDIQAEDFVLPQLSVQPLVENAVKHGVGMKEDGGTVTIATRETDKAYEVIVSDDGVGFDTSAPPKNDGRSHVGMENVKQRLKEMCNAEVIIESEPGKGTVSTIRIPKEDNN